jgi:hypothetical protein
MTYFWQNFNTNLNKIVKIINIDLKRFFENVNENILSMCFKNQSPKGTPMVPISLFPPN